MMESVDSTLLDQMMLVHVAEISCHWFGSDVLKARMRAGPFGCPRQKPDDLSLKKIKAVRNPLIRLTYFHRMLWWTRPESIQDSSNRYFGFFLFGTAV